MSIEEKLEAMGTTIQLLVEMQHQNEKRFEAIAQQFQHIAQTFVSMHDSIKSLENIALAHEQRLDDLEAE